jgi:hypothetical protein
MLVLALQFSRDVAVCDTGDALTCVARVGMDREEGARLPHNGTGTPGDSGSGGAVSPRLHLERWERCHGVGMIQDAE